MAIQRHVKRTNIAKNTQRVRVLVLGEECPPRTNEARIHQALFLSWLADNQHMLVCDFSVFEKLVITHNGTQWQAEAEAEVEVANGA